MSGQKHCAGCGEWKDPPAFHRDASKKDGRSSQCAKCRNASTVRYFKDTVSGFRKHVEKGQVQPYMCPWCKRLMKIRQSGDVMWMSCRTDNEKTPLCPIALITREYRSRTRMIKAFNKPFEEGVLKGA